VPRHGCLSSCNPAAAPHTRVQHKYVVLSKADIKRRQEEVIEAVTSVVGISAEDAARILRKYKWCVPDRLALCLGM
jgi:hypothetical protein